MDEAKTAAVKAEQADNVQSLIEAYQEAIRAERWAFEELLRARDALAAQEVAYIQVLNAVSEAKYAMCGVIRDLA